MNTCTADTPQATLALGVAIGETLRPGDILGLIGTLGAGKTLLVHGIVQGILGRAPGDVGIRVCSPSYTMVNTYSVGEHTIHHLDLYRLSGTDDLESIGYWDVVEEPDAIVVVEWIDQIGGALPESAAAIELTVAAAQDPNTSPRTFRLSHGEGTELYARLWAVFAAVGRATTQHHNHGRGCT